jgi:hypothetical protein
MNERRPESEWTRAAVAIARPLLVDRPDLVAAVVTGRGDYQSAVPRRGALHIQAQAGIARRVKHVGAAAYGHYIPGLSRGAVARLQVHHRAAARAGGLHAESTVGYRKVVVAGWLLRMAARRTPMVPST